MVDEKEEDKRGNDDTHRVKDRHRTGQTSGESRLSNTSKSLSAWANTSAGKR